MFELIQKLDDTINSGADFLHAWVVKNKGLKLRSFYGETFSLLLLAKRNKLSEDVKHYLIDSYDELDKKNPEFHWEFNNYALLKFHYEIDDRLVAGYLDTIRFKGTKCANWSLLRLNTMYIIKQKKQILDDAFKVIKKYQKKSGLILDLKNVKSFQYHCFSCAMIGELYMQSGDKRLLQSFNRGVEFIKHFILPNGEALYIGRGQNQSFGYGVLIYILALDNKINENKESIAFLSLVLDYISDFQSIDGSIPLVVGSVESSDISNNNFPETPGWYPYNNYFDYFPFLLYFLDKAYRLLCEIDINQLDSSSINLFLNKEYKDCEFIKIANDNYIAIVSKPGGYWTNDLSFPYLYSYKANAGITPIYGGEQFQKSFYDKIGLPLPYLVGINRSLRDFSFSKLFMNRLIVVSIYGVFLRKFEYNKSEIIINDFTFTFFAIWQVYHFLKEDNPKLDDSGKVITTRVLKYRSKEKLIEVGNNYSAKGILSVFKTNRKNNKITLSII